MAITTALCNSFKQEILQGIHLAADTYKIALYTSSATLNKSTTSYSATNEVSGAGYTAGGATLASFATGLDGDVAYIDWADPSWANATITARGALIYNASRSNKAVATFDFGGDIASTNSTWTATLPVADASNALIRIA